MKTKNIFYLISVLLFTILFYRQEGGINVTLFTVFLLAFSAILNKPVRSTKRYLFIAGGALLSSFFVMVYASGISIVMCIFSLLILIFVQRFKSTSYLVALVGGISSVIGSVLLMVIGRFQSNRLMSLRKVKQNQPVKKWFPILIVAIVAFLFLSLYRSISPVFDSYFTDLIGNISWGWIFITVFATILLYPFFYPPRFLRKVLALEQNFGNTISEASVKTGFLSNFGLFSGFETERFSAYLLFVILNLLLLLLNGTDIHYLFLKGELPAGITYSDYVHSGVGAVILSILMAIALIVYYFRGQINFDSKSKTIRQLAYLWIAQNIFLVGMAGYKNQLYIDAYSLTYLRIGVYYFLTFSMIGLFLTIYKIWYKRETWFLFQSTGFAIYTVLILSCMLNWNNLVTQYNLKNSKPIDYDYLYQLGYENYPLLWEEKYFDEKKKQAFDLKLTGSTRTYLLPNGIGRFLQVYEQTGIQSYNISCDKVYRYFAAQANSNKLPIN